MSNYSNYELAELVNISVKVGGLEQRSKTLEKTIQLVLDQQKELIAANQAWLQRIQQMPDEEHQAQHQFLETMIRDRRQVQELRQQIIDKIITGGVLAFVSGSCALVWLGFKTRYGIGE